MIYALLFKFWLLATATQAPQAHVLAALQAETPSIPATLLLAQAWKESRWTAFAVSRVELQLDGSRLRRAGTFKKKFPPYFRGPYFCGASQLQRKTEKSCRAIGLDTQANYLEARKHIEQWLVFCARNKAGKHNLDCALAGYGGGIKYAKKTASKSRPWKYGQNTQRLAKSYERKIQKLLGKPNS